MRGVDPEGGRLTFALITPPTKGTARVEPTTGVFTYVPTQDENGFDSFTFSVTDSNGARSAPALVTVAIAPVNDPPTFLPISSLMNSPESVVIRYKPPVVDVDGDTLTLLV